MTVTFPIPCEWIFIDDKSSDHSLATLQTFSKQYGFRILLQPTNQGKGAAVIRGIREAKGDILIVQDADSEYNPREISNVIRPILDNEADVVYGSRFQIGSSQIQHSFHTFVNRFLTLLSNLFSGLSLTDMETCYKAFRSDLLKSMILTSQRFGIEVEVTAYTAKTSARVVEVPISYSPRTQKEGKKISWRDGVAALGHLIRFNCFTPLKQAFHQLPSRYDPKTSTQ